MQRLCPVCYERLSNRANYCPICGKCMREKIVHISKYAGDENAKEQVVGISDLAICIGEYEEGNTNEVDHKNDD